MFSVHLNKEDIDHWVSSPQVGVLKVLVDHSGSRGGRAEVEGCGGSGVGGHQAWSVREVVVSR